jgi:DNA primase
VINNTPGVGVFCFRCGFRALWAPGDGLSRNIREFMAGVGMSDTDIKRVNLRALQYKRLMDVSETTIEQTSLAVAFTRTNLPKGARSFQAWAQDGCEDPNFHDVIEYLFSRGDDVANSKFFWTPHAADDEMNRRVIIPFYRGDDLVGWTARSVDKENPKRYHSEVQPDYLFNNRVMYLRDRRFLIVVEGVFDAIAIDGVGTLGAKLNEKQIHWLKAAGKDIILVPDRDEAGGRLISIAKANNWKVAFPALHDGHGANWWDNDVKDVAEAVRRYGRLYTLCSILKTAVNDPIAIAVKQKLMNR